jgi:hypothetical protein
MNETNRLILTLLAGLWIILMAVIIFLAWAAPDDAVDRIGDFAEFLDDNNTNAGKLIVTLAALAAAVLGLLVIIVELAPEDEPKDLRVEQAGATTIVPADALRMRLEEALLGLPEVTAARSKVWSRSKGIAAELNLTVTPEANVSHVTQEAARVVVDTVQTDLGLPVAGIPTVKIAFGGSKTPVVSPLHTPLRNPAPLEQVETVDERISGDSQPPASMEPVPPVGAPAPGMAETPRPSHESLSEPPQMGHADSSPGPLVYEEGSDPPPEERRDESSPHH